MKSSPSCPLGPHLQEKVEKLKSRQKPLKLGRLQFANPLFLAPMSAITNFPFRLLMEDLGAGATVSELISCHGLNYGNEKTQNMLTIHPRERNVGLQLFGEEPKAMAKAAQMARERGPKFIDINMGCPVRKVVSKGGGSALMKEPAKLGAFFSTIKRALGDFPLTLKIRTGWDENSINAQEILHIAHSEGLEFVAIHGRTRAQGYRGEANWPLLEEMAKNSPLPLIGNGDLHSPQQIRKRREHTHCQALMLGRGPLRDPFIFLTSYHEGPPSTFPFGPQDYKEITHIYFDYLKEYPCPERAKFIQLRKIMVWFAAGFPKASSLREKLFKAQEIKTLFSLFDAFFDQLNEQEGGAHQGACKEINLNKSFMAGGHG